MKILIGKYSGFCKGVNSTYYNAKKELDKGPVYCLGELIHNEHVIHELEEMGMKTINSLDDINDGDKVIFRAHGEPKERYNYAKEHNISIIDLTCEKVKIIHDKVEKAKDDSFIIIIGKKTHPEIIGTVGFAGNNCIVIEDFQDLEYIEDIIKKSKMNKIFIVSQTTFSSKKFDLLVDKIACLLSKYEIIIDKSICKATENRQSECDEISKLSDYMIVIGSKKSSNTRELYDISINNCKNVFFVEDLKDLDNIVFNEKSTVGVVAGASTPISIIDSVVNYLKEKYNEA